jgi:hypothetical protein
VTAEIVLGPREQLAADAVPLVVGADHHQVRHPHFASHTPAVVGRAEGGVGEPDRQVVVPGEDEAGRIEVLLGRDQLIERHNRHRLGQGPLRGL